MPAKGGYTVHPVPTPCSTKADPNNRVKAGGNNQKLILFNLGKAICCLINYKIIRVTVDSSYWKIIAGPTRAWIETQQMSILCDEEYLLLATYLKNYLEYACFLSDRENT